MIEHDILKSCDIYLLVKWIYFFFQRSNLILRKLKQSKLTSFGLGGPALQWGKRLSNFIVLSCIISYCFKSVSWLMCLWSFRVYKYNLQLEIEPCAAVVNSYTGLRSRKPVKLHQKPQQSAMSNTNRAEPHGNSIMLTVNRTPALRITVSKLQHQHTTTSWKVQNIQHTCIVSAHVLYYSTSVRWLRFLTVI